MLCMVYVTNDDEVSEEEAASVYVRAYGSVSILLMSCYGLYINFQIFCPY